MSARPLEHVADPRAGASARGFAISPRYLDLARSVGPYALVVAFALLSRLRYAVFSYHDSYSSGDAHLVLARALLVQNGIWHPPADLGAPSAIFSAPPLLPFLFTAVAWLPGVGLASAPLIAGPVITIVALCAFYATLRRAFDPAVALAGAGLAALIPRFALDSTEPDKVAYVVAFWMIALYALYRAQERSPWYLVAGAAMGLAVLSHTTAYLFLPVYVLSHVALSRGSRVRLADRFFCVSLLLVAISVATFVLLDDHFERGSAATFDSSVATGAAPGAAAPSVGQSPPAPAFDLAPADGDARFIPNSIEHYYDMLSGIARDGFRDSAWDDYGDGIRRQITLPVYLMAAAGFVAAVAVAVARRQWQLMPIVLWMGVVTVLFAVQYPAPSHHTRYPSYVTPAFVALAAFAVVGGGRWLAAQFAGASRDVVAVALAAPLIAFAGVQYAVADDVQQRELYAPHRALAEYVHHEGLLSDGSEILYLGWPSATFYLLDGHPELVSQLNAFGWGYAPAELYTPKYVAGRNIRYFVEDHTAGDYDNSAPFVRAWVLAGYNLVPLRTFCIPGRSPATNGTCAGPYVVLHRLEPK